MTHIFLIVAFIMIASCNNTGAQSNKAFKHFSYTGYATAKSPDKKNHKARLSNINSNELNSFVQSHKIQSEIKVTAVNIKAVRDFIRSHVQVTDPKWFRTEGGYLASFLSKGIFRKIVYDHNGRWLYNLLEYTEDNLAFEVRHMVKSRYYDNDILLIPNQMSPLLSSRMLLMKLLLSPCFSVKWEKLLPSYLVAPPPCVPNHRFPCLS